MSPRRLARRRMPPWAGRVACLAIPLAGLALLPAAASAAPVAPHLDPAYAGGTGMAIADFPTAWEEGVAVAPAPASGAYVAGTGSNGESGTVVIAARFTDAGELDKAFSGDGRAVGIAGNTVGAGSDAEGRVVLAIQTEDEHGDVGFAFMRLTATGEMDTGYGDDGLAIVRFVDAPEPDVKGIHVDPDGSAVAVGSIFTWGGHTLVIASADAEGNIVDRTISMPSGEGQVIGLKPMRPAGGPEGTFVVASRLDRGDTDVTILTRHSATGELDTSFGGGDGLVEAGIDGTAFATGADGSVVVAAGGHGRVQYERYDRDGGKLGEWSTGFGAADPTVRGVAVAEDGRIVASGRLDGNAWVARYGASGAADEAFGDKGRVVFEGRGEDVMLTAKGPVVGGSSGDRVMAARIGMAAPVRDEPQKPKPEEPQPPAQEVKGDFIPSPPAVRAADLVTFPPARRCVSRRRFRIRLRERKGVRTVSATVFVNGRQVNVVRGKRLRAPVDLRGLPKGRFKVKITLTLEDGRTISGTRRYRTCAKKRRGKRPIKV